jgi:hypothetical protein
MIYDIYEKWYDIRVVQASQIGALLRVGHCQVDGGEERVTDYVTTREVTLNLNLVSVVILLHVCVCVCINNYQQQQQQKQN